MTTTRRKNCAYGNLKTAIFCARSLYEKTQNNPPDVSRDGPKRKTRISPVFWRVRDGGEGTVRSHCMHFPPWVAPAPHSHEQEHRPWRGCGHSRPSYVAVHRQPLPLPTAPHGPAAAVVAPPLLPAGRHRHQRPGGAGGAHAVRRAAPWGPPTGRRFSQRGPHSPGSPLPGLPGGGRRAVCGTPCTVCLSLLILKKFILK